VFTLELPGQAPVLCLPIVGAGRPGSADLVGIRMKDPAHYRFVYESWGVNQWQSPEFEVPEGRRVAFRVRLGPLLGLGTDGPVSVMGRSLVVWRDGVPVWWRHTARPIDPAPEAHLVSTPLGSTVMDPVFRGRLLSVREASPGASWNAGPFRAVTLRVAGRGVGCEPLASIGGAGSADTLGILWPETGKARLVYRHGGRDPLLSPEFAWNEAVPNEVRVEMPAFAHLDGTGAGAEGPLRVGVGGAPVWERRVPFFTASSKTVAIGRAPAGSTAMGAELTVPVIDIRQEL
jgi:hypothetical protein